ncbi:MAG: LysR family transcriptional regulator [Gammaproteobacteria bacterium]|nr:LysR family transcriptional regulator [Gammaproteobacteria bacterium]MBQ0840304.1 LysR family transcriptional regulator [Gammaproteobacteria bacterium]
MNLRRIDLNLLVYLDVLLHERNVTKSAAQLGITQPAMSNGLRRLRDLFEDPLLIRTSDGMSPTQRALELQPQVRDILANIDRAVQPQKDFDALTAERVFRIMASDYAESTLIAPLLSELSRLAPGITLDILTPSDVRLQDVEQGRVDMLLNRFDEMPQSFHQLTVWEDDFSCLLSTENPLLSEFSLDNYLLGRHVWVSKTGMGASVGMNPRDAQRVGRVDEALKNIGKTRHIAVFTRHYQVAVELAQQPDLIVTIPTRLARLQLNNKRVALRPPPFDIPSFELKMAWSPLLQHNPDHQWIRRLLADIARREGQV